MAYDVRASCRADLINAAELCFLGISVRCFMKLIGVAPTDPSMIGKHLPLYFMASVFQC